LNDVENDAKFRTFDALPKLGEAWARSICQLLKHNRTSGIHMVALHSPAAEHSETDELKKERKKRTFMVKLKAFNTNVGRPNATGYATPSIFVVAPLMEVG